MPGFDFEKFPFLVCQGTHAITLINVGLHYATDLVLTEPSCAFGQQAIFFSDEEDGISLNYTVCRQVESKTRYEWVKFLLRSDLLSTLRRIGKLPSESTKQQQKDIKELRMLNRMRMLHEQQADEKVQAEKVRVIRECEKEIKRIDA